MGEVRHHEALAAAKILGVDTNQLVFLGYPDFGTLTIWYRHWADRPSFESMLTKVTNVPYEDAFRPGAPYKGEEIVRDLEASVPVPVISRRFHNGIVEAFARAAELVRDQSALNRVCLSGGSFQNAFLLEQLTRRLAASGFDVYSHSEVPAGDGGLSLGQAVVAASTHM